MKLDGFIDAKKDGQKDWQTDYYEASYNWKWDPHNLNCSKLFLYSIVFEHVIVFMSTCNNQKVRQSTYISLNM